MRPRAIRSVFVSRAAVAAVAMAAALPAFSLTACGGRPESPGASDGQAGPQQSGAPGSLEPAGGAADPNAAAAGATGAGVAPGAPPAGPTAEVLLFFPDATGTLRPEKREVPWDGGTEEKGRRVVQALLEGPAGGAGEGLTAVAPRDAALLALYLGDNGTAYVDLDAAFARGLSDGSEDALLAVWSITDSLAANLPDVRRVKILVEGEEVRDLGGHLDLSRPLVPGMAMR